MTEITNDKRVRLRELDIAKGIAILSVIIVHIPSKFNFLTHGITWHLSTFFLVAGILECCRPKEYSLKLYVTKRIKSLIKPYIILSSIYIVVYSIIGIFSNTPTHIARNIYLFVSLSGIGTLWFLPTFFIASVIFYFVINKFKTLCLIPLEIIFVALVIVAEKLTDKGICGNLRLNFKGIFINAFVLFLQILVVVGFFAIGYHLGMLIKKVQEKLSVVFQNAFYGILGVSTLVLTCFLYKYYAGNNLLHLKIKNSAAFIVCTVLGAVAIIFISKLLSRIKFLKLLEYCGVNSLIIMTTHLEYHIIDLAILIIGMALNISFVSKLLIFIFVVAFELIICFVINKVSFLRCIFKTKR